MPRSPSTPARPLRRPADAALRVAARRTALRAVLVAAACLPLAALPGCDRNPATGKRQLSLVSEEQELQIGREAAAEIARSLGLVADAELQRYVERIGRELAEHSERPNLPWTFQVVDDATPNAFALPGGHVFVTRGLLALMNSEAELASVLGHEIAHVTARHGVNQMSKQQLAEFGLNLGVRFFPNLEGLAGVAGAGLGLVFLKYGRDAEREADELGFRYAYERNYDVREMADVFAALQRAGEIEGRAGLPGWLSTHPAEPERIRAVEQRIARLGEKQANPRVGEEDFLRRLDGLAWGDDPRNGYFEGGTFYHPELAFRFDVPDGWRTQNMASAVLALSPRRDGIVQLTFAGASPEEATRALLAQPGVRGEAAAQRINGVPAIVTRFEADDGRGTVRGYVAFLAHGDATYQLTTYAPAGAYAVHADDFRRVVGSFAPLADRAARSPRPDTLDVVRLDRSTTLVELARREPRQSVERLALLNQVDDPARPLPAGTYVKRVLPGAAAASGR